MCMMRGANLRNAARDAALQQTEGAGPAFMQHLQQLLAAAPCIAVLRCKSVALLGQFIVQLAVSLEEAMLGVETTALLKQE